ncbi:hypothetical protein ABPG74_019921 [Tetrahymena malaccensis]
MSKQVTEKAQEYRTENKYDPYLIRDTVNTFIENILEKNEKKNYTFSNKFLDTKIVLGFLILIVILVSHYYPLPFPKNLYILIACVTLYFILSNYYSHYENSVEGDTFALFSVSKQNTLTVQEEKVLYRFNSNIEMLSDELELSISTYNDKNTPLAQQKIKINEYFDQDGYLCTIKLQKLVDKMLASIKSKSE